MVNKGFDFQLQEARSRVKDMDIIDGSSPRSIDIAISALEAGLRNPSTGAAFDALVMLQDLRERCTK